MSRPLTVLLAGNPNVGKSTADIIPGILSGTITLNIVFTLLQPKS